MSDKTAKSKTAEKKETKAHEKKATPDEKAHKAKPAVDERAHTAKHDEKKATHDSPKAEGVKVSVSDVKVSEASNAAPVSEEGKAPEEEKAAGGFRAQKKAPEKAQKKEEKKVLEERIYTIPLDSVMSSTRKKRANKAVRHVRNYLSRHMHSDNVKISAPLNELLWSRGIQKPPRSVKVKALKYEDSVVAELSG